MPERVLYRSIFGAVRDLLHDELRSRRIGGNSAATAILDSLLQHSEILQNTGKSYRLRAPRVSGTFTRPKTAGFHAPSDTGSHKLLAAPLKMTSLTPAA